MFVSSITRDASLIVIHWKRDELMEIYALGGAVARFWGGSWEEKMEEEGERKE
jgi:hypothetical protein